MNYPIFRSFVDDPIASICRGTLDSNVQAVFAMASLVGCGAIRCNGMIFVIGRQSTLDLYKEYEANLNNRIANTTFMIDSLESVSIERGMDSVPICARHSTRYWHEIQSRTQPCAVEAHALAMFPRETGFSADELRAFRERGERFELGGIFPLTEAMLLTPVIWSEDDYLAYTEMERCLWDKVKSLPYDKFNAGKAEHDRWVENVIKDRQHPPFTSVT
jgi:hypothetical protein